MNAAAPARGACAHCGLPARIHGEGPAFCCSGCALAWHLDGSDLTRGGADRLLSRVVLSAFLAMGVMVASLALYGRFLGGDAGAELASPAAAALEGLYRIGAATLTLVVFQLLGVPLLAGVVVSKHWSSADALVLAGTSAALGVSLWNTFAGGGHVYFETASMVLVLVGLGRWMDARAKERARARLAPLARERIGPATRVDADGERSVDVEALRPGDLVRVRCGECVPVDGEVESGRSFVETSSLTGEERPRAVGPGERVLAGSVALDGALVVRARAVVGQRVRDEVEALLAEALAARGRGQRVADRAAALLLPAVLVLAIATALHRGRLHGAEEGLLSALAVVLISCPCALGIATPLAYWSALGDAWRRGALVRGAEVLERLATARTWFFDKTGTLTERGMQLVRVDAAHPLDELGVLRLAAALELGSEHPIAASLRRAWVERAGGALPETEAFRALPGVGVEGTVEGRALRLRRADGVPGADGIHTTVRLEEAGRTLARFVLAARLRPEAPGAVDALRAAGSTVAVLTGDSLPSAADLERRLGIPVEGALLPADKVERVRRAGRGTVYVGDGLNDTAALAAAEVGIAVAGAAPRNASVADVQLLVPHLDVLPELAGLARRAVRTARRNLVWAFSYNAVGLWLAATGRLTPIFAAAAMVLSSLAVVASSRGATARERHGLRGPGREPVPGALATSGGGS